MKKLKLLIVGHGRHGKDTVCDILKEEYRYSFESSSAFCSKLFIYDLLKDKYKYSSEEECYADRHNHRAEWYNAISSYNIPDGSKLGKAILNSYDIYCGLRNKRELYALKNTKTYDYAIWVDRSMVLPAEEKSSMTIEEWMCDFTIDNNGSLEDLRFNVRQLFDTLHKTNC